MTPVGARCALEKRAGGSACAQWVLLVGLLGAGFCNVSAGFGNVSASRSPMSL